MLFNSLAFFVFLAVVWLVYLVLPRRAQNRWLLAASYFFYGAWDWRFLGLILASTLIDYFVGLGLERTDVPRRRRLLVSTSIVANLALLGAFKYAGFFMDSLVDLLRLFGIGLSDFTVQVVLPVGISFYTFQTLSYTIDIYRRQLRPTRDLFDFALYVAFFPQLVAGPIERATNLLPQIQRDRSVSWEQVGRGSWLILWGLFKKVVIADNLWPVVDAVYAPGAPVTGAEALFGTYAFCVLIYCDFAGYSDIARGTARLLGFELMLNFRLPYFSHNLPDLWRRWHISLSTWLRDYVYVPMGGGRHHRYRNLFSMMVLCGFWHGASWTFVLFGAYHGALLCLHRWAEPWRERWLRFDTRFGRGLWLVVSILITFHIWVIGAVAFRAESIGRAWELWTAMLNVPGWGMAPEWLLPMAVLCAPLLAMQTIELATGDLEPVHRFPLPVRGAVYALLLAAIILLGEDFGEQFAYFQF